MLRTRSPGFQGNNAVRAWNLMIAPLTVTDHDERGRFRLGRGSYAKPAPIFQIVGTIRPCGGLMWVRNPVDHRRPSLWDPGEIDRDHRHSACFFTQGPR